MIEILTFLRSADTFLVLLKLWDFEQFAEYTGIDANNNWGLFST